MSYKYLGDDYERYAGRALPQDIQHLDEMIRIRIIEEEIASNYHQNEMKTPIHLMIGQEAVVVGAMAAMFKDDRVYSSHRTHGVYLAKGGDEKAMLLELYGRSGGCSGARGGSMHLIDKSAGIDGASAIVGGIIPIAAGAAFASLRQNSRRLTTVFFGDGAMEEGVVYETLNLAALWKLPILFLCENNFYSVCTPLDIRQANHNLAEKALALGVSAVCVDGNNVYEMKSAVQRARERAIAGLGPSFIEARVYRWLSHGGADDDSDLGYRLDDEVQHWKDHCPIVMLERFLLAEKIIKHDYVSERKMYFKSHYSKMIEEVKRTEYPDPSLWNSHVYAP